MSEDRRAVDPHRLAQFLDGDLDAGERARTISELADLPCEQLEVFADAAAILRGSGRLRAEPPTTSPVQ